MSAYDPPTLLNDNHQLEDFISGEGDLDHWFKTRARKNMQLDATRVYVVCANGKNAPIAYYGLSTAHIMSEGLPGRMRRNMPDPIPALLLGRLAIHVDHQGKGLGRALIQDASLRALKLSDIGAARLIVTHALTDNAASFYESCGFIRLQHQPRTLVFDLKEACLLGDSDKII